MSKNTQDVLDFINNQFSNDSLKHFGVLGMKWGRRKKPESGGGRGSSGGSNQAKPVRDYAAERAAKQREKIMSSPSKLYKNRRQFTDQEIQQAISKMRMERELKQLHMDKMAHATKYVNTILAYGETAKKAYDLYNSPLGKLITSKITGNPVSGSSSSGSSGGSSSGGSSTPSPLRRGTGHYGGNSSSGTSISPSGFPIIR